MIAPRSRRVNVSRGSAAAGRMRARREFCGKPLELAQRFRAYTVFDAFCVHRSDGLADAERQQKLIDHLVSPVGFRRQAQTLAGKRHRLVGLSGHQTLAF